MELTLDRPGDHFFVRSVSSRGIETAGRLYRGPLILSAGELVDDWDATNPCDLSDRQLNPIFELEPDVVLLGTGAQQRFPDAGIMSALGRGGIALEVMRTDAACRTYNILMSEGRNVAAALLMPNR